MSKLNIRITELESTLLNCRDDHTPEELQNMEQELEQLREMESLDDELSKIKIDLINMTTIKPWRGFPAGTKFKTIANHCMKNLSCTIYVNDDNCLAVCDVLGPAPKPKAIAPEKDYTFDFIPDKIQPLRRQTCITARCECTDDYEIIYTFDYVDSTINLALIKNRIAIFTKNIDNKGVPMSIHEAERMATNAVTDYITNADDINMSTAILSRLRSWHQPDGKTSLLKRYMSYVYISDYDKTIISVETKPKKDRDIYSGQKILMQGSLMRVTRTVASAFKKTKCQLIYIKAVN